ncbi:hypothetical protein QE430_002868 [Microbacterium testaceum]|nr:hypothetical protein [Microbacterium testaceum]
MRHAQNSVAPREGCGAVFSVDLLHAYCKHCDGYPPAELALKAAQPKDRDKARREPDLPVSSALLK